MKRVLHIVFAITLGGLIPAAPVLADMTTLNYDVIATAEDFGPQDGTYDAFAPFNLGLLTIMATAVFGRLSNLICPAFLPVRQLSPPS